MVSKGSRVVRDTCLSNFWTVHYNTNKLNTTGPGHRKQKWNTPPVMIGPAFFLQIATRCKWTSTKGLDVSRAWVPVTTRFWHRVPIFGDQVYSEDLSFANKNVFSAAPFSISIEKLITTSCLVGHRAVHQQTAFFHKCLGKWWLDSARFWLFL